MHLYESDFYTWTQQQSSLLRAGNLGELDIENLIEEIEDMGASERHELENRLAVLLAHLIKWQYQPSHRSNSWRATIMEQRVRIEQRLRKNPGLKPNRYAAMPDAYETAIWQASKETGLPVTDFPTTCPWIFDQAINKDFWPD